MLQSYQQASTEVLDILNHMSSNDFNKVSKKFIEFLTKHQDSSYTPNFDYSKKIYDMALKKETCGILSVMYRNYWCDDQEKDRIQNVWIENQEKLEASNENVESLNSNDNIETIESSENIESNEIKQEIIEEDSNKDVFDIIKEQKSQGLIVVKETMFTKFVKKVKAFFNKNK